MFRPASNCLIRGAPLRSLSRTSASASASAASRRFLSTAPPSQKSRSWKSAAVRWGLAGAAVYYYNTSNVFAEEPAYIHAPPEVHQDTETALTLDSIAKRKEERDAASSPLDATVVDQTRTAGQLGVGGAAPGSPEELEEEAGQEGAFNPETGEINWDCPCLGGMANGPCGEEFKAAFSCFVYSTEEPKGVDCIDKFKGMQDCFRLHPDIYGAELDDDDEESTDVSADGASGLPLDGAPLHPSVDEPSVPPQNPSAHPAVDEPSVAPSRPSPAQHEEIAKSNPQKQTPPAGNTSESGSNIVQELRNGKPRSS